MASMGIGTNILGYSHSDEAVIKAVIDGNIYINGGFLLAEKLIDSHSWADMMKFVEVAVEMLFL